jgi:hypothetical protein
MPDMTKAEFLANLKAMSRHMVRLILRDNAHMNLADLARLDQDEWIAFLEDAAGRGSEFSPLMGRIVAAEVAAMVQEATVH